MTTKEILHKILLGMDGYLSVGVPVLYLELAKNLTLEVYGNTGVGFLEKNIKRNNSDDLELCYIYGTEDNGNTYIGPEELIERLEKL